MKSLALLLLPLLAQAQYQANWASLDKRPTPQWYPDAKFGIFIHWGVYAVPSYAAVGKYSEWYWNSLTGGQSGKSNDPNHLSTWAFHQKTYGANFTYPQFAPMFKAELYDPQHWAEVFEQSGAKYVVLTSKHHDGYALWPSAEASKTWGRPWTAAETGPQRDLIAPLTDAVRARGLRMGFYYSLYEWYNPLWLADRKRYVAEHMMPQFKDLVNRYQPSLIFADGEWDMPSADWRAEELLQWLYNDSAVKSEVIVNDRWGKESRHHHGGYYTTEYTAGLEKSDKPWEESRGMGHSYGFNRMEQLKDYRTPRELVWMLIDLVSRGGNLLLDIGPDGDGTIPVIMEERLRQMGQWMKVNGEAIYGTRPWKRTRQWSAGQVPSLETGTFMTRYEVEDYVSRPKPGQAVIQTFFTAKGGNLYAILPLWPGKRLTLRDVSLDANATVRLLGGGAVAWKANGANIELELPDPPPAQEAYVVRLTGVK